MRVFLGIVVAAIVAGLAWYGVSYGPAQMQTLAIAPKLPSERELRQLLSVENGPVSIRYIVNASQEVDASQGFGEEGLAHTIFVVEWENGDLFLIDLGMDQETADEFAVWFTELLGAGDDEFNGDIANILGPDIAKVAGVGLTHLHEDHIQGIVPFCKARGEGAILLQTEPQRDEHNFMTEESADLVAGSCLERSPIQGGLVKTHPSFPGLGLVEIGGHTPGSTLIAVAVKGHLWLFSGDVFGTRKDLLEGKAKPLIYTTFIVPENRFQNSRLRPWLRELDAKEDIEVVVSHSLERTREWDMPAYSR